MRENKYDYIDALRGIAIFLVLLVHSNQHGSVQIPHFFSVLLSFGSRGVQLFFIVSALTLFLSFNRRVLTEKKFRLNFFIRRFFRIAPIYYLGIIYYIFQNGLGSSYWLGDQDTITNYNIISNITFMHGFNPYWITSLVPGGWSITVEMSFYIFVPFIFKYIKTFNKAINFFILSLILKLFLQEILLLNSFGVLERLLREYIYLYFPSQLPVFAIGFIVYFMIFSGNKLSEIKLYQAIFIVVLIPLQIGFNMDFLFVNHILFSIMFSLLTFFISKGRLNFLVNKISIYLGKISYSLYITHFAVIYWLEEFNMIDFHTNFIINFIIKIILVTSISSLISTITYNLIENRFQVIAKRIISKIENRN